MFKVTLIRLIFQAQANMILKILEGKMEVREMQFLDQVKDNRNLEMIMFLVLVSMLYSEILLIINTEYFSRLNKIRRKMKFQVQELMDKIS
jgi:hypothetical protein